MTGVDRTTDLTDDELRLRAELARTLVPPPTPTSLRMAVDALAARHLAAPAAARRSWWEVLGRGTTWFRLAAGAVTMVVLAVVGLVLLQGRVPQGQVAATPFPTLPAVTQPALPDRSGAARITTGGAWIDANTAWVTVGDATDIWMTTDGGQTWSERGSMGEDLPPVFLDASNGYAPRVVGNADAGHAILVSKTTDGGQSWLPFQAGFVAAPDDGSYPVASAHFTDPLHGVVLGTTLGLGADGAPTDEALACAGWSTDDGGEHWAVIATAPCVASGIRWASPLVGLVADPTGTTFVTDDGGRTWEQRVVADMAPSSELWTSHLALAADGTLRLVAAISTDGLLSDLAVYAPDASGTRWRAAYTPRGVRVTDAISVISDLGGGHWLAIGEGNTIPGNLSTWDSYDEGRTWTRTVDTLLSGHGLAPWFDRLHGTVYGGWMDCRDRTKDCSASPMTTWFTNDGGRSWHEVPF